MEELMIRIEKALRSAGETSNLTRSLLEARKEYEYLSEVAEKLKQQLKLCMDSEVAVDISTQLNRAQAKLKAREDDLFKLLEAIESGAEEAGEATRSSGKHFHKEIFLKNVRYLTKKNDIKLKDLEAEGSTSVGITSRLERPENKSDPSIEYIVAAADVFGVSVDSLIRSEYKETSPTEDYIIQFLSQLIGSTEQDETVWTAESSEIILSMKSDCPILCREVDMDMGCLCTKPRYDSKFYPTEAIIPVGNSYNAQLPGTNEYIYLMKCAKAKFDDMFDACDHFYEIYIVTKQFVDDPMDDPYTINPLCCTAQVCSVVGDITEQLYKTIEASNEHLHINRSAMDTIGRFMSRNTSGIVRVGDDE